MAQRLLVAILILVDASHGREHVSLVGQVAELPVDGAGLLVRGKSLFVAAVVVIDAADIVMEDRQILSAVYLGEDPQRRVEAAERFFVAAGVQVHSSQIAQGLRLAPRVARQVTETKRVPQVSDRLGVASQVPAGDS